MKNTTFLKKKLSNYQWVKLDKVYETEKSVKDLSYEKLLDTVRLVSIIEEEDAKSQSMIATMKSGFLNANQVCVAIVLREGCLSFAAYANEGLIKQHSSEKAVCRILEKLGI